MKMIFKNSGRYSVLRRPIFRYHGAVFIVLFVFVSALYADVTVNNLKKNDKISADNLVLENDVNNSLNAQGANQRAIGQQASSQQTSSQLTSSQQIGASQDADNEANTWELHAEQWELARSGESLLSLPVLNQLINTWLLEKHRKIEVQYPGGEEGEFWVQELTDWLVSLGIPSSHMVTTPGSGADDMIKFGLIK